MTIHTFHLATTGVATTARTLAQPPTSASVAGLRYAECMTVMELGLPVVSPARLQMRHMAMFAAWDSEAAVDDYLAATDLGRRLAVGWHVRLEFVRRWGHITEFEGLPTNAGALDPDAPAVAVTLARLKLPQVPRFIRWGKPAERLVRDHPGTTLALAAMRPLRTVSTFSVWRSVREMTDMVHGHSAIPEADRHATAMVERRRKDFHFEFTTLRFRPLGEFGAWKGREKIIPTTG